MTDRIVCPYQETDGFSFDECRKCKRFEASKSVETSRLSVHCREQKTRQHKLSFESGFFSDYVGLDYKIVIEAKKDINPKIKTGGKTL